MRDHLIAEVAFWRRWGLGPVNSLANKEQVNKRSSALDFLCSAEAWSNQTVFVSVKTQRTARMARARRVGRLVVLEQTVSASSSGRSSPESGHDHREHLLGVLPPWPAVCIGARYR